MCIISVVIATYNGEKYIAQQLESIINQLDDKSEIIISDNNSTDNTIKIIQSFNNNKIKLYTYSKKGIIANFENALKHASGEIIFLSDQDDIWFENKVSVMKKNLENYDLVMSDSIVVDENLAVINNSFYAATGAGKGLLKNFFRNTYQGSNMAFKRKILKLALPFPQKIPMHDIWIAFIAELFYKICFIPDKLALYRRHTEAASTSTNKSKYGLLTKIMFRLQLLQQLPQLIIRRANR